MMLMFSSAIGHLFKKSGEVRRTFKTHLTGYSGIIVVTAGSGLAVGKRACGQT